VIDALDVVNDAFDSCVGDLYGPKKFILADKIMHKGTTYRDSTVLKIMSTVFTKEYSYKCRFLLEVCQGIPVLKICLNGQLYVDDNWNRPFIH
jgi:hypothetical protein